MAFPVPRNEPQRLEAVREYEILDSAPELAYDEITELAAQIAGCPVASIGMMDETREWFKSKYGVPPDLTEIPREMNVCNVTICGTDVLVVPDLSQDERFRDYPMIAGEPGFRFYCGAPLINPEGYALGTLCVLDFQPREPTRAHIDGIRRLSHQVVTQLELRRNLLETERTLQRLDEARREIERQREQSERLLRSILPGTIADELKEKQRVVPRFFPSAAVLFADFEGFTRLAERLEPKGLVEQLDQYFSALDEIAERHGLEMLKTVGDCYMCVGGLPEPNRTHPLDACLAALEMQDYFVRQNRQREKLRLPRWELRIGIHTGPVMAGVVGRRKFLYDVWGDAVNIAARMESAGEAGRINVSEEVRARVDALFDFEPRGSVEAKNKGKLSMFYLMQPKPAFREGTGVNEAFRNEAERSFPGFLRRGATAGLRGVAASH
jgi:adenylate cyclase